MEKININDHTYLYIFDCSNGKMLEYKMPKPIIEHKEIERIAKANGSKLKDCVWFLSPIKFNNTINANIKYATNMDSYLYILDYSDGSVCEIKLTEDDLKIDDLETLFNKYNLNIDTCSWMFTSTKRNIINLNN